MLHGRPRIHLCNPLTNAAGGSEWRTVNLYRALRADADVTAWTNTEPHAHLARLMPICRIRPARGMFPRFGTIVFVGSYHFPGRWSVCTWPVRIVIVHNTTDTSVLRDAVRRLSWRGRRPIEIVYASAALRDQSPFDGVIEPSLIDVDVFRPMDRPMRPFTVGRLSRDVGEKHHPEDQHVYRALCLSGARIRLMGGTSVAHRLKSIPGLEIAPACAEPPQHFLQSLDCFFYRTSDTFFETFGRVVLEAMACGLPVVCSRRGGYTDYVEHGRSGFLFESTAEAMTYLEVLRNDPSLRAQIGAAARRRARQVVERGRTIVRDFYLQAGRRSGSASGWAEPRLSQQVSDNPRV